MGAFGGGPFPGGGGGGPGPAGPAGPAGAQGPAGADGISTAAATWFWVEAEGVEGGDLDFDPADWVDAFTVPGALAPQDLAVATRRNGKRLLVSCPAGYGALFRPVAMADTDVVCIRVIPRITVGSANTLSQPVGCELQVGAFEAGAAQTKYTGIGPRYSSQTLHAEAAGGITHRSQATASTGISASTVATEPGLAMSEARKAWDVLVRRVGSDCELYVGVDGGAWTRVGQVASANLNMGSGTVHVGVRYSASTIPQAFEIVAFKHFAGGLPSEYL